MSAIAQIKSSYVGHVWSFLFAPKILSRFKDSHIGRFLVRIENQKAGQFLVSLSLFFILYEYWLNSYIGIANSPLPLGLLIVSLFFLKKEKLVTSKPILYLMIFLVLAILSAFSSVLLGVSAKINLLGFLIYFQFALAVIVGMIAFPRETLAKLLVWLTFPLPLLGLGQFATQMPTSRLWLASAEEITTRAFGFFGSPNVYGIFLTILFFLSLTLYLKNKKLIYLLSCFLNFGGIMVSFSRTAWVALVCGLIVFLFFFRPKYLLTLPLAGGFFSFFSQFRDRFLNLFSQNYLIDSSLDGRIWSLINGWHLLRQYPILGTGPGSYGGQIALAEASPVYLAGIQEGYTALYYTDNQWLEILVQLGLAGTVAFVFFVFAAYVLFFVSYRQKGDIMFLGTASILTVFVVAGFFANVIEFSVVAVPVGLILGASFGED